MKENVLTVEMMSNSNILSNPKVVVSDLVYYTKDLSIFKKLPVGNRDVNKEHLKQLRERIMRNPLRIILIVNNNFEVIDGQHRLNTLKLINVERSEMGVESIGVEFVVCSNYTAGECLEYNGKGRNWSNKDTMKSMCDRDSVDYKTYLEFQETYNLNHNEMLCILSGKSYKIGLSNDFKNGIFKVREDVETAHNESKMIIELAKTGMIPVSDAGKPNSVCAVALLTLFRTNGYDHQKMVSQLNKAFEDKVKFMSYHTVNSAIIFFENVYNNWNEGKNRFRFISEEKKNKYLLKEARKQYSNKKQK
jgi:hypothetical protein